MYTSHHFQEAQNAPLSRSLRAILPLAAFTFMVCIFAGVNVRAQTTEFVYQGQLQNSAAPANGSFDFEFLLYDALTIGTGTQQGSTLTRSGVTVTNGIFAVKLDFGSQFPGAQRFLEIHVRQTGGGGFTQLTPRQAVSNTPYAVKTLNADTATTAGSATTATTATTAGNVTGTVAIANGGTGSTTQNFVDLTTTQTVAGSKTFSNDIAGAANVNLSTTNAAGTVGVINQNGNRLIHSFGTSNFFAGPLAGNFTMTGNNNTAIGIAALLHNTGGLNNTAIGGQALTSNTVGTSNTASGAFALGNNTSGGNNTASGSGALNSNTTGGFNTASGFSALFFNTTGSSNIGVGSSAGVNLTTGSNNIDIGNSGVAAESDIIRIGTSQTDTFLTGIVHGTFSGSLTGNASTATTAGNVTGTVAIANGGTGSTTKNFVDLTTTQTVAGSKTFNNDITGAANVNLSPTNAAGTAGVINQNGNRLIHSFGTNNFFAGPLAGNFTMTGNNDTAIGVFALSNNTTGLNNMAIGGQALTSNTVGASNTASGQNALGNNTSGSFNAASGSAALNSNTTGGFNTASGFGALFLNTTGSHNIGVGSNAGQSLTTGDNNIDIGNSGVGAESDIIRIGTSGTQTKAFVAGIRGTTTGSNDAVPVVIDSTGQLGTVSSSRRYKQDIKNMGFASDRLMALRPVTFRYKQAYSNGEKPIQFGLIAEEVAKTFPELVVFNKEGQPETVKYQDLTPLLLNEVQKQAKTIGSLVVQTNEQAKQLAEQKLLIEGLRKLLCSANPKAAVCKQQ